MRASTTRAPDPRRRESARGTSIAPSSSVMTRSLRVLLEITLLGLAFSGYVPLPRRASNLLSRAL